jgi:MFS family permease
MPLSGALAGRFGCRDVLVASTAMIVVALPLLAVLKHPILLAAALVVFGAGVGSVDCVINIQAIIVERASGKSMMSGFHGLWSVGGIMGSAGLSALLAMGASTLSAAIAVVSCVLIAIVFATPYFLTQRGDSKGFGWAIPRGRVLFIGGLCFILFMTEGSVLDWSAVFLTQVRHVDPAHAGLGFTAFSVTMTAGRLLGDSVVRRVGGAKVIMLGGLCAAVGFAMATVIPFWPAALIGFALVGVGCANIVPVLFTAVGRQKLMPEAVAVPLVTMVGYSGILLGPALIGLISSAASLTNAFLFLAVLLLGVAASGNTLKS